MDLHPVPSPAMPADRSLTDTSKEKAMTQVSNVEGSGDRSPRRARRATAASMIGAVADWYDYFLYGTAAALVFGGQFFPGSGAQGTLAAFATFAVGFFFRPVGSIIFGHFGDRIGRKQMLVVTMLLMGTSSALIGLLPTYGQVGIAAPIALVVLRALQGIAVGGEWGGAALIAVESAPAGEKARRGSVVQTGAFVGLLAATLVFYFFSAILSDEAFRSWGWRVPFLLSVVILAAGYWVRRKALDSPEFEKVKRQGKVQKLPLLAALRAHPKSFFIIVGMFIGPNVATYMVLTFSISYAAKQPGVSKGVMLITQMIAAAACLITIPVIAKWADRNSYFKTYVAGAVAVILLTFPYFWSVDSGNPLIIGIATVAILAVGVPGMVGVQQPIFAELFGAEFRYSGAGFAYQFGAAVAGVSPFLATYLVEIGGGNATLPSLYLIVIVAVALLTAIAVRKQIHDNQNRDPAPVAERSTTAP
jgi:MHS family shikimate/dehydroshikimate transporter-like MFS transporter